MKIIGMKVSGLASKGKDGGIYFLLSSQINFSFFLALKKSLHLPSPLPVIPPSGLQMLWQFSSKTMLGMSQQ
jgi:hypothetical protein